MRIAPIAAAAALLLALAGCSATGSSPAAPPAASSAGGGAVAGSPGGDKLTLHTTSLGEVVADADGHTVYVYDKDTQGTTASSCTGACITAWPPVLSDTTAPTLDGVSGTVATIAAPGGGNQVTLDGWPLYYYAGDGGAGDATGQGVGGIWWVLGSDGAKLTASGASGTGDSSGSTTHSSYSY